MGDTKRSSLIDISKCIAILAVLVDHSHNTLYSDSNIQTITFFSVSLFVLLSGMTSYYSCYRHMKEHNIKETFRRLKLVLIPYAAATALYQTVNLRMFNFEEFWNNLIHFNAATSFYFVLFYIQLVIISPWLFNLIQMINKMKRYAIGHILVVFFVIGTAVLAIKYTQFPGVYGGGEHLLGGTYLVLFYLGMMVSSLPIRLRTVKAAGILMAVSGTGSLGWYFFLIYGGFRLEKYFPFGEGFNPPGICLIVYSLLVGFFVYGLLFLGKCSKFKIFHLIMKAAAYCGRFSLYIFLYHRLVQAVSLPLASFIIKNLYLRALVIFGSMFFVPIIVVNLILGLKSVLLNQSKANEDCVDITLQ